MKCYSGYAYLAGGISVGIGSALTSRWIIWKDQPVPPLADVLSVGVASVVSGYGLYQLKTGKGCKTYKSMKKHQKKHAWSLKKTAVVALAVGIPMGLILYMPRA